VIFSAARPLITCSPVPLLSRPLAARATSSPVGLLFHIRFRQAYPIPSIRSFSSSRGSRTARLLRASTGAADCNLFSFPCDPLALMHLHAVYCSSFGLQTSDFGRLLSPSHFSTFSRSHPRLLAALPRQTMRLAVIPSLCHCVPFLGFGILGPRHTPYRIPDALLCVLMLNAIGNAVLQYMLPTAVLQDIYCHLSAAMTINMTYSQCCHGVMTTRNRRIFLR